MKVTIVGGSGFIGSNLSNLLDEKKHSFDIFDLKPSYLFASKTIIGDIKNPSDLNSIDQCDAIINLAAVHRDDIDPVSLYDEVNIQGSKNVCDLARKKNIKKIIFTSSVAVYGFAEPDTNESGKINYFNDYGRTKYLAEKEYLKWFEEDTANRSLIIIRPTVVFGEGNRGNVFNLLKQIQTKRFVMFGDGKNVKSMAYVENVAAFIEFSLSMKQGMHLFNYIDKPDIDMNNLISMTRNILFGKKNVGIRMPSFLANIIGIFADTISKSLNKNLPISSIRVKKFLSTTKFSSSVSETGFIAPCSLEEGLKNTINYEFLEDNSDKPVFDTE